MENKDFVIAKDINGEGGAILQIFRLLTSEEQRIACAVLDGMQLQKQLDTQHNSDQETAKKQSG